MLRALTLVAATLGGLYLPRWPDEGAWDHGPEPFRWLARWDSGFYLDIAARGRVTEVAWAFSPGYPYVIRGVRAVFPALDPVLVGGLVSLAFAFLCVPLLYHLTRHAFDARTAFRATAMFVAFPSAFYLGVVYPEGMFTACALAFFLGVARRWWLLAGVAASVAAVTRPQGVLLPGILLLALALEWMRARRLAWTALPGLALAAALPILDALHAHALTGDFTPATEARLAHWPDVTWHNPGSFLWFDGHVIQRVVIYVCVALALAALAWAARDARTRRLDAPLAMYAYAAALVVIILSYSDLVAVLRYTLPLAPVFWMLAATPERWFGRLVAFFAAAQVTVAMLFGGWFPLY